MTAAYVNPTRFLNPLLDGYALGIFARMLAHAATDASEREGEVQGVIGLPRTTHGIVEKTWFDAAEIARELDFYDRESEGWDIPSVEKGLEKLVRAELLIEEQDHWVVMFDEMPA